MTKNMKTTTIEFTRVNNDINGNPRYVCHFLNIADNYETAIKIAHQIGGRKFHNKQYGGGIVFQSYSLESTERDILEVRQVTKPLEYEPYLTDVQEFVNERLNHYKGKQDEHERVQRLKDRFPKAVYPEN
jgi:hypothetical protein